MSDNLTLTESQMVDTFGRAIANKVKIHTTTGDGIFDEFEFKGRSRIATYDYYSKSYYVMTADAAKPAEKQQQQQGGTIITVRTKQVRKPQPRRLEMAHS